MTMHGDCAALAHGLSMLLVWLLLVLASLHGPVSEAASRSAVDLLDLLLAGAAAMIALWRRGTENCPMSSNSGSLSRAVTLRVQLTQSSIHLFGHADDRFTQKICY